MDPKFTGSVINALPMDRMIGGPLNAMITAQVAATRQYTDFLLNVCLESDGTDGKKAVNVTFDYDETIVDTEGNFQGVQKKTMRVPLLAVVTHPSINVEEGTVDFELEVSQSEEDTAGVDASTEVGVQGGWGPVSASFKAKVSAHAEHTRKTDTRAKYSFHTIIKRSGPTEGLMRVIDFLTDAATKPVQVPGKAPEKTLEVKEVVKNLPESPKK